MIATIEPATIEITYPSIVYDLVADEYHRREIGVASNTALKQVRRSPAHYRQWLESPEEATPAMEFGKLLHSYALEPAKCLEAVALMPNFGDLRTKAAREARDAWLAQNDGKLIVSHDDWDKCRRMGDAIHKVAGKLIGRSTIEASLFWIDAETGIRCKCRLDGFDAAGVILDVKTTEDASPAGFARSALNYGYDVQAAFYCDGWRAIQGREPKAFLFIAVEKSPPFDVVIHEIELESPEMELGRSKYRAALERLRDCLETDEWPGQYTGISRLTFPRYAFME